MSDLAELVEALHACPASCSRDEWISLGMAFKAAGGSESDFLAWSSTAPDSYVEKDARAAWRSFKGNGTTAATLFKRARDNGWKSESDKPAAIWDRCIPADASHGYIKAKEGMPDGLRVLPAGDPLLWWHRVRVGDLVVPLRSPLTGELRTLQFIPPGKGRDKHTLYGAKMADGVFVVGELVQGGTVYVVEGLGQGWSCWKATGHAAAVTFGASRMAGIARTLRKHDPTASIVVVPDVGKETEADDIAREVGGKVVRMPESSAPNYDANDFARDHGGDELEALLDAPAEPGPSAPPRTRHANGHDTNQPDNEPRARALDFATLARQGPAPARSWWLDGWTPRVGGILAAGAGGIGKSQLEQHAATCGALGRTYFAPVVAPYRSLIWACEDEHDELWRRQEAICQHEGVGMAELAGKLHIVSRYGCDNPLMAEVRRNALNPTRLLEELRQQVNDLGVDVLWLDNVAHFLAADHDDRTVVTRFINEICGLVRGRSFAVVFIGHTARAAGSEFTGSVAWENACRMRWYLGERLPDQPLETEDEPRQTDVRFLCRRKSNYSAKDYVRFQMRNGLLVPDEPGAAHTGGLIAALDERRADEVCIAAFRALSTMGLHPSDGKSSSDYLPRQAVAKQLAGAYSKGDLERAMNRLMSRGVLARGVVGRYANRAPKQGLILKQGAA